MFMRTHSEGGGAALRYKLYNASSGEAEERCFMEQDKIKVSFSELATALAKDYESIFVIDPKDDSYVEYVAVKENGELGIGMYGDDFYADTQVNARTMVCPEDQEVFLQTFRKSRVIDALKNGSSFVLRYRLVTDDGEKYYALKTIKGDDERIFIAVQNIDEQVRKEKSDEDDRRVYFEIINSIGTLFEVIYHVSIDSGHYTEYSMSRRFSDMGIEKVDDDDFFEKIKTDIGVYIFDEDQENLMKTLDRDNLKEKFKTTDMVSVDYRQLIDGKTYYFNLIAFKQADDDNHLVVGVRNVDNQKRNEQFYETYSKIAGALASRYEIIYYVNLVTNNYTLYSAGEKYAKLGTSRKGGDFFKDAESDIRKYIYKEDVTRVLDMMKKENVLDILSKEGSMAMSYRQVIDDTEPPQYVSMHAVRPKNDDEHLLIGVANIDAQVKREEQIKAENRNFGEIATALARRYEVIYQVNVNTNEYLEYTSSEKYARLDIGSRGKDFFAETQENMKEDIFPEDLPMMALAMQKETLLKNLDENGKFNINYRLIMDGRPQYVTLMAVKPMEDSEHIIVAVSNIDSARKRELEFEEALGSAMEMANNDSLTGLKNKRYYAQKEMYLDMMIEEGKALNFAVVVCDINGLKQINDKQGHKEGDSCIRDAAESLRSVFKNSVVFRVGGDEFAVILEKDDYKNRDDLMSSLSELQEANLREGRVTMAFGISDYKPKIDHRVEDVFERADKIMYLCKESYHASKDCSFEDISRLQDMEEDNSFHEFFEQLVSEMTSTGRQEITKIESILIKISSMFRLSKAVTRVYRDLKEEKEGGGETLCCYDTGTYGEEIISIRLVSKVMTVVTMQAFMSPNERPLSSKEKERVELCMRTTLTYISRNRIRDMVEELTYLDEKGYNNLRAYHRYIMSNLRKMNDMVAIKYNLRHFSLINRELGMKTGDIVMRKHFDIVSSVVGENGFVARLGGDNFVLLCEKNKLGNVLTVLSETEVVYEPVEGESAVVTTSAGVFRVPKDMTVTNPGDIMDKIIIASNTAQTGGKDNIVFYSGILLDDRENAMKIQRRFPEALKKEEFQAFYQPKVDIRTGEIIGAEALCRWIYKGKMISPGEFIPALEETSDICKLDFYMLDHVCRDIRKWLDNGMKGVRVSVNMSRKHMLNVNFLSELMRIIDRHNVPHSCIEIELTETTIDVEFNDLKKLVSGLQREGIFVSVDDFGVGFSSLNLIREIRWNVIKVDRSFLPVEGDNLGYVSGVMFKYVIAMMSEMGVECIVEGVETEKQLRILRENKCFHAQGFYFDKPLPKKEFEKKLAAKFYDV